MKNNASRNFWISLMLAVGAAFLVYSYSQEKKAEYDKKMNSKKTVVVAAKDIIEMQTVDESMLTTVDIPQDYVQPSVVENPEEAIGMVAATTVKKGEQLLSNKLLTPGPNTGLSFQVAPGKRAITIPIDDARGVARLIRPGDRVDILYSVELGAGQNKYKEVRTLLQDVIVLAAGHNVTNNIPRKLESTSGGRSSFRNLNGDTTFSHITVEVAPYFTQYLIYLMATNPGGIFMTLRNPNDRQPFTSTPIGQANFAALSNAASRTSASVPGTITPPPAPVIPQQPVKPVNPRFQRGR